MRAGVQESPRGGQSNADTQSTSASRKEQWGGDDSDEEAPDPRMWFEGTSKGHKCAPGLLPPLPSQQACMTARALRRLPEQMHF